jgi:Tol biopolymer transport system component/tRNA A-37 threonylcarbamoyl transferase component Bud32
MHVCPGSRLGRYEILSRIGVGGMGEVYRARDSKLGRDVAIKVLPEEFARDRERMIRFEREARLLAALNHPNIASIYGVEDSGSVDALVMELAEGPTLADRIRAGLIPIHEALSIARQIADALEYAHERGVVHCDLKPSNIKISREDMVKVLDFGLAKAVQCESSATDIGDSPTLSEITSKSGALLGTAAYMAPEQAKAKPVDRRIDIWAFGCVLYEMLTAKKVFPGDTVPETLAAVLKNEPYWSHLPSATPAQVCVLLRRCLQKDPKQRLRDIGDARISLDEVLDGAAEASPGLAVVAPFWRRVAPWALFGVAALSLAMLALVDFRERAQATAEPMRLQIALPEKTSLTIGFGNTLALSPDGRHLAFAGLAPDGHAHLHLWVRDLDSLVARPLPGAEGALRDIFWSPDSKSLAFHNGRELERIDISGGSRQVVCAVSSFFGGAWSPDGIIIFGTIEGLMKVSAAGGQPSLLIKASGSGGEYALAYPSFLPDARHFVYSELRFSGPGLGPYVGSIDAGGEQQLSKPEVASSRVVYLGSSDTAHGRLLFLLPGGTLMAQVFDPSRARLEGDPAVIAQGVADFTVSANGLLAYSGGTVMPLQLTWFNRQGKILGTVGEPGIIPSPALSLDDSTVAVPRVEKTGGLNLWLYDLARGTQSRFTFDGKANLSPVWSPDGRRIAFSSRRDGSPAIYEKAVNGMGQEEPFETTPPDRLVPRDWSRDGHYLLEETADSTSAIWLLPLAPGQAGGVRKSVPYLNDGVNELNARLSPNGKWIAYDSDETGRDEIFVQTFPKPGGKWQVSTDGGTQPVWSRDGRELYFIDLDGILKAAEVKSLPAGFESSAPQVLFNPHPGPARTDTFDVAKDGRFLIPTVIQQPAAPITVVVNWQAALKK